MLIFWSHVGVLFLSEFGILMDRKTNQKQVILMYFKVD